MDIVERLRSPRHLQLGDREASAIEIERLRTENKTFRAAQKACEDCEDISGRLITWIKCSDKLPEDFETVLIASGSGSVCLGFSELGEWQTLDGFLLLQSDDVTHWAKLPAHPEET